ncbi:Clavaminate synthase-like protein [Xylariaceae sp. FL0255]|nr:Clavaminate synthase-like protein [Xylariaceae sp. FL0255]
MASRKQFEGVPPFPTEDVPVADIQTISLSDLRSGNEAAGHRLLNSCQELGFFLLDLRDDEAGRTMIDTIDRLFGLSRQLLTLPEEEKQKYLHDIPRSFLGFKPRGLARTETNEPDRFEWYNIGRDGIKGVAPLQPLPPLFDPHLGLLQDFFDLGQELVTIINAVLASHLGLPCNIFTDLQSPDQVSGTVLRFIKNFATKEKQDMRTSMIHHTDFGSITLLANILGGLQILTPGKSSDDPTAWRYIMPTPGCLIVNLGDAMVQWTGGILRSNVHRVTYAPGTQGSVDRYSLGLFVRPNRDASMNPLLGEREKTTLTAWEWEQKKMMSFHRGNAVVESIGGRPLGATQAV